MARNGVSIKAEYDKLSVAEQNTFNAAFQEFTVALKYDNTPNAMAKAEQLAGIGAEGSDIKEYFTDASSRIDAGQYVEGDMIKAKFGTENDSRGNERAAQGKTRFESILMDDPSVSGQIAPKKTPEEQVATEAAIAPEVAAPSAPATQAPADVVITGADGKREELRFDDNPASATAEITATPQGQVATPTAEAPAPAAPNRRAEILGGVQPTIVDPNAPAPSTGPTIVDPNTNKENKEEAPQAELIPDPDANDRVTGQSEPNAVGSDAATGFEARTAQPQGELIPDPDANDRAPSRSEPNAVGSDTATGFEARTAQPQGELIPDPDANDRAPSRSEPNAVGSDTATGFEARTAQPQGELIPDPDANDRVTGQSEPNAVGSDTATGFRAQTAKPQGELVPDVDANDRPTSQSQPTAAVVGADPVAQEPAVGRGASEATVPETVVAADNSQQAPEGNAPAEQAPTGQAPAEPTHANHVEITPEEQARVDKENQSRAVSDPNAIIINEADAQKIAHNLNDGKAANDSATLGQLGVESKATAYTDKDFSKSIAGRASGGFTQAELDEIRGMSQQDNNKDGKSDHIKDSEKGQNYKQEISLDDVRAPTISAAQSESKAAER